MSLERKQDVIADILAKELPAGLKGVLDMPLRTRREDVPHAPHRTPGLSPSEMAQALSNALRYFPAETHATLAPEFAEEMRAYGHIYMYRLRPTNYAIKGYPLDAYPGRSVHARSMMLMIMNNLSDAIAQYPDELITYGGNGSVFSNWAQYRLTMAYLCSLTDEQTLVMCSGHPQGVYPSHKWAPRCVITNGMVIPNYSRKQDYDRMYAMGVSQYGQMTAGSYCYIGPQGIVHGTTITILNAGRKYLPEQQVQSKESGTALHGVVYVSSGLGGMSGAQGKAAVICGAIGVIAETDKDAIDKRHKQGWVDTVTTTVADTIDAILAARREKRATAIAFHGNVVTLWEGFAEYGERQAKEGKQAGFIVNLGSDQTSCHNVYGGGYTPVGLPFEKLSDMLANDPQGFKGMVDASLKRHISAINRCVTLGMRFWDYGNSFLLSCARVGGDVFANPTSQERDVSKRKFKYPSYVEEIMGDVFSLGFGPFRWVCTSGSPQDLQKTDILARKCMVELSAKASQPAQMQYRDNIRWIEEAQGHQLVVGTQARILYADARGRQMIARTFNQAVQDGDISGPVVCSRDHHDVSGTDSPYRETSNITDGSKFCADMAVQNVIGDACRGASWVALHNGGGVGWGEVVNGGFGLVLDGSSLAGQKSDTMLFWDVLNGLSRRAWSGHPYAQQVVAHEQSQKDVGGMSVTLPYQVQEDVVQRALRVMKKRSGDDGLAGQGRGKKIKS